MEAGALFVTAFIVGLSGAMMPGPLLTTAIAETMRRGFWAGPQIILGHAILELALVMALLGGLASFLVRNDVAGVIALLGGIFLIFMAFTMLRDTFKGKISLDDNLKISENREISMHPIIAGIAYSFANPLWHLWWATVGLSYISMAISSNAGLVSFFSGHITADLSWYSLVSLAVSSGRRFINQSVYNFILVVCGVFILGFGFYFILLFLRLHYQ